MTMLSCSFKNKALPLSQIVDSYNALAIDIDGTLIRNEPIHAKIGVQVLHDYGVTQLSNGQPINETWWFEYLGEGHRAVHNRITTDNQVLVRKCPDGSLKQLGPEAFTQKCSKLYQDFLENVTPDQSDTLLRPGMSELVSAFKLAGKPVSAVSGNEHVTVLANIRAGGMEGVFDHVVSHNTMAELGLASKPSGDPYLHAAKLMGVAPRQILAIEDSLTGVKAAKAANVDVVHILYQGQQATSGAKFYVRDDQDIRAALDNRYAYTPLKAVKQNIPKPRAS